MFHSPSLFNRAFSMPLLRLTAASLFVATLSVEAANTALVSVSSIGEKGNSDSFGSSMSAAGRFVAFSSYASNLVPNDTNGIHDVFVHDRVTGQTERVSVTSSGVQGNNYSYFGSMSANGRFVGFHSLASNLVPDDTNETMDAFVHDRVTGQTERISVSSSGTQGDNSSVFGSISANGRFVVFWSDASNLVPDDANGSADVFIYDRASGKTTRVSVSSSGVQGNYSSFTPSISADGRFVAFTSDASNLVPDDMNDRSDIFVHDRVTGQTERVSVSSSGTQGDNSSVFGSISADGRFVAFHSYASNLVPDDTNETTDAFVHDRVTGKTERISVSSSGVPGNDDSYNGSISADGRFVTFYSLSSNLVPNDTNETTDAFVHDRVSGTTERISLTSGGNERRRGAYPSAISADGRFVVFNSKVPFVAGDKNWMYDVYVRDRVLNKARNADLQVSVTEKPSSVIKGKNGDYLLTVRNAGPDDAAVVNVTDVISHGMATSLTSSQGNCSKAAVSVCRLGLLAAGASATVNVTLKANSNLLRQQISVNADPVDNTPLNNTTTFSTPVTQ